MTDWSFKSFRLEMLVKSLVYKSTADFRFLFFVNCDVCHIKFIVEKKIEKIGGGGAKANCVCVCLYLISEPTRF